VHLVVTPGDAEGLWRTFRKVHRHYTGYINARLRTTGHLWQGRYGSVAMDEGHLLSALRYVALNPVRARRVARAGDWRWSSTPALLAGRDDAVVRVAPALGNYGDGVDGARERHLRAMMIVVAGDHQRSAVHGADYHSRD
jgi:putative transposase